MHFHYNRTIYLLQIRAALISRSFDWTQHNESTSHLVKENGRSSVPILQRRGRHQPALFRQLLCHCQQTSRTLCEAFSRTEWPKTRTLSSSYDAEKFRIVRYAKTCRRFQ